MADTGRNLVAVSFTALIARDRIHALEPLWGGIACVGAAAGTRLLIHPLLGPALPFATFFPAVLVATMLWGGRWGTATLLASGLTAGLLFIPLDRIGDVRPQLLAALGLFAIMGSIIVVTGTALRRAIIELAAAKKADALRKQELQHRLKNTLAIVQSFASYLSRTTSDKAEFEQKLTEKIIALAKASDILFADKFESCKLVEASNSAMAAFNTQGRIVIRGPDDVQLPADSCEPLILALHELGTNAHKYGALSVESGHVELSWRTVGDPPAKCIISWVEKGGPPVVPPSRQGLGQHLLRAQKGIEEVTVRYEPGGVQCDIVTSVIIP
jgi:two-component sensor histidine kinase